MQHTRFTKSADLTLVFDKCSGFAVAFSQPPRPHACLLPSPTPYIPANPQAPPAPPPAPSSGHLLPSLSSVPLFAAPPRPQLRRRPHLTDAVRNFQSSPARHRPCRRTRRVVLRSLPASATATPRSPATRLRRSGRPVSDATDDRRGRGAAKCKPRSSPVTLRHGVATADTMREASRGPPTLQPRRGATTVVQPAVPCTARRNVLRRPVAVSLGRRGAAHFAGVSRRRPLRRRRGSGVCRVGTCQALKKTQLTFGFLIGERSANILRSVFGPGGRAKNKRSVEGRRTLRSNESASVEHSAGQSLLKTQKSS